MVVSNSQIFASQEIIQRQDTKNKTENEEFASLLEKTKDISSNATVSKSVTDSDVENFLDQLTSMGASAFWINFNLEKIQDKIEQKREELMEKLGLDEENVNEMTSEEKTEALDNLEEMLNSYIKELMEQMEAKKELDSYEKGVSTLSDLLKLS